eukprot:CAMPEP_0180093168 /NCGR_PEP_ID=MMETSP0985-20121206/24919_1 /TAXON_ID=483367 /ORGANISM="non described non described, Strain CCMP 2436" /LENGTH=319 /DNA_ID=CAMNT_0022028215 /DNA_START=202 /DNA_END=1163 /DNA_ORIENTATION=-
MKLGGGATWGPRSELSLQQASSSSGGGGQRLLHGDLLPYDLALSIEGVLGHRLRELSSNLARVVYIARQLECAAEGRAPTLRLAAHPRQIAVDLHVRALGRSAVDRDREAHVVLVNLALGRGLLDLGRAKRALERRAQLLPGARLNRDDDAVAEVLGRDLVAALHVARQHDRAALAQGARCVLRHDRDYLGLLVDRDVHLIEAVELIEDHLEPRVLARLDARDAAERLGDAGKRARERGDEGASEKGLSKRSSSENGSSQRSGAAASGKGGEHGGRARGGSRECLDRVRVLARLDARDAAERLGDAGKRARERGDRGRE